MVSSLIHAPRLSSTSLINLDGYSCKPLKEIPRFCSLHCTPLFDFISLFSTSFQLTVSPKITIERCLPQHNYYCFGFDILDLMALLRKTLAFFTQP